MTPHCPYMVGSSSYQVSEDALVGSTVTFNDGVYRIEDEDVQLGGTLSESGYTYSISKPEKIRKII